MTFSPDRPVSGRNTQAPLSVQHPQRPHLGIDVLLSGDLIRSADLLPGDPTDDCPVFAGDVTGTEDQGRAQPEPDVEFGDARRGFVRYRLATNFIRVQIFNNESKPALGRMTNASVTGLFVRCQCPLPVRTTVRVEWSLLKDLKMSFMGRVIRTTGRGMAIHLATDDANWRFRASFIDLCRTPTEHPPGVIVRRLNAAEIEQFREDDELARRLGGAWTAVQRDLNADDQHQAFIQQCLKARRLQFAFERYRELQEWPTPDFDPTPYLKQIGTILSFYQLQTGPKTEPVAMRKYVPLAIVTLALIIVLLSAPYLVGARSSRVGELHPGAETPVELRQEPGVLGGR